MPVIEHDGKKILFCWIARKYDHAIPTAISLLRFAALYEKTEVSTHGFGKTLQALSLAKVVVVHTELCAENLSTHKFVSMIKETPVTCVIELTQLGHDLFAITLENVSLVSWFESTCWPRTDRGRKMVLV